MSVIIIGPALGQSFRWRCTDCKEEMVSLNAPKHTCASNMPPLDVPASIPYMWTPAMLAMITRNTYCKMTGVPVVSWEEMGAHDKALFTNLGYAVVEATGMSAAYSGVAKLINAAIIYRYYQTCADRTRSMMEDTHNGVMRAVNELKMDMEAVKIMASSAISTVENREEVTNVDTK